MTRYLRRAWEVFKASKELLFRHPEKYENPLEFPKRRNSASWGSDWTQKDNTKRYLVARQMKYCRSCMFWNYWGKWPSLWSCKGGLLSLHKCKKFDDRNQHWLSWDEDVLLTSPLSGPSLWLLLMKINVKGLVCFWSSRWHLHSKQNTFWDLRNRSLRRLFSRSAGRVAILDERIGTEILLRKSGGAAETPEDFWEESHGFALI